MPVLDRALLDAHVFLWALEAPERLSTKVRKFIESPLTVKQMSSATVWEIVLKREKGKLNISLQEIADGLDALHIRVLPVSLKHLFALPSLGAVQHSDPFDRLLIATAYAENCAVATADAAFKLHTGLKTFW